MIDDMGCGLKGKGDFGRLTGEWKSMKHICCKRITVSVGCRMVWFGH